MIADAMEECLHNSHHISSTGTTGRDCKDDIVDVLNLAYNLRYGGNDLTVDAANLYISGAHVTGEEQKHLLSCKRDLAVGPWKRSNHNWWLFR